MHRSPWYTHQTTLKWRDFIPNYLIRYVVICSIFGIFVISALVVVTSAARIEDLERVKALAKAKQVRIAQENEEKSKFKPIVLEPLPFPLMSEDSSRNRSTKERSFKINDAEFTLKVRTSKQWAKVNLSGEAVRFGSKDRLDGELIYSAGCFGPCDTIEDNIALSLSAELRRYTHQGKIPRVTHWHVHHKTWVEYSILYQDSQGQAWLHGASIRLSNQWINALKCEYTAPIDLSFQNIEILHLAWDPWVIKFIDMCRNYKVVSWE